jgi:hypothetical protein
MTTSSGFLVVLLLIVSDPFFACHTSRVLHVSWMSGRSLQSRDAAGRGRHVRDDGLEAVGHCGCVDEGLIEDCERRR